MVLRAARLVFAGSIGGLVGAAIASASAVHRMTGMSGKVIVPMILLPSLDSPMVPVDDH